MIKRIFIAGPKSGKNSKEQIRNIKIANEHAKKLVEEGHYVYVPHNIIGYIKNSENQKKYFINLSKSIIKNWATHIYMLPNWKTSAGAVAEYNYAKKLKIKILRE